jgi:hypothetical protein
MAQNKPTTPAKTPLKPTDPHPDDDERMASLREFGRERLYANDFYGGHKGSAEGEPNDPFKLFRWIGCKLSGKKWEPKSEQSKIDSKPPTEPKITRGEVDTHNLL